MSSGAVSVLDFGAESTVALMARKGREDVFQLLGGGEAISDGIEGGEIVNVGDVVESIVEAVRKAESSSGLKVETLYYNFDDAGIEGISSRCSKNLEGEGQVRPADIRQIQEAAERLVNRFEKSVVYSRDLGFLIDGKDPVLNPVGVFGRTLDVFVYALLARSEHCDRWNKAIKRCHLMRGIPVFSPWSTAYGVLAPGDRDKKRLIWDLGADLLNGFIFENNRIKDCSVLVSDGIEAQELAQRTAKATKEFMRRHRDIQEVLVTGELSPDPAIVEGIQQSSGLTVSPVFPSGIPRLDHPRHASLVGLLRVAEELEAKTPRRVQEKYLFRRLKDKALSLLGDYF